MSKGAVRFVYRHLPLIGPESVSAAVASECAGDQGRFWEYHDSLYQHWAGENRGAFSDANLKKFAQELGLNLASFTSCMAASGPADRVQADKEAASALDIRGTPVVFINGQRWEGLRDYELYRRVIEEDLRGGK